MTLVHGTVVDPSNLPPAPDEAALLEELEFYPVDADELTPVAGGGARERPGNLRRAGATLRVGAG